MIRQIDLRNSSLANDLYDLQKESYLVEAQLVDYYNLPPLIESFQQFIDCQEMFIGCFESDKLIGAISYSIDDSVCTICRMVVRPGYFRRGIAQNLLEFLEKTSNEIPIFKVSTGKDNEPAKRLYQKNGFILIKDIEAEPGFYISYFEKKNRSY